MTKPLFKYESIAELTDEANRSGRKISDLVLEDQSLSPELQNVSVYQKMKDYYRDMQNSVREGRRADLKSISGLTGGEAHRMDESIQSGSTLTGSFLAGAICRALAVSGLNAAMGRIVASPTAGSCGILPAAVITMQEEKKISEDDCIMSLFTASAVGMVISKKATLAGAEGGCQAECGSASAMAAAAVTELAGGTPDMISNAIAISLKCCLGLVCDPVAGLVEVPCIKRNASGVTNAFTAAEMALAGITSAIPADEVIDAMKQIGNLLPVSLKETAGGGLAATPTGRRLQKEIFGKE
ncbi:MAG: L-serine ammonia-lyase, iron-sulfur-dependent, subunit alpha [Lachnospiraceae bacterium]|jgi:L-serine dehydratase|nr:L-serine ammonia-lyase, iron-sulfur-dependent, subunit alpha [Lachnospiraceae bacterium]MCI1727303.1 L-serine ammonia-lyase, iron-sulfur-dependent, subunit alpha [Lachnospiraceae bacterium]